MLKYLGDIKTPEQLADLVSCAVSPDPAVRQSILVTVAVVITGLLFAFGESGGAFRRIFGIAFGAAIALGALTVLTSLGFVGATF